MHLQYCVVVALRRNFGTTCYGTDLKIESCDAREACNIPGWEPQNSARGWMVRIGGFAHRMTGPGEDTISHRHIAEKRNTSLTLL